MLIQVGKLGLNLPKVKSKVRVILIIVRPYDLNKLIDFPIVIPIGMIVQTV